MAGNIFVTGDCHGDFRKFSTECFAIQKDLDKDDYMIICGDFGGIWNTGWENKREKYWLDWLEEKPFTVLFCDGNHENFDRLNGYPLKEWHGGKVHEIRPHVLHLMRGEIYTICDKTFFVFGGAASHDIKDGILDTEEPDFKEKKKFLDSIGGMYRINHLTWWKEELPTEAEIQNASQNLEKHNFKVDYIITHELPLDLLEKMYQNVETNALIEFLQTVKNNVSYRKWFAGHHHMEKCFDKHDYPLSIFEPDAQFTHHFCLYDTIMKI